jgi:hypothetical protein
MEAQPIHNLWRGLGFGGLTQQVGIGNKFHSVSVDSEGIGSNQPFTGQDARRSTNP